MPPEDVDHVWVGYVKAFWRYSSATALAHLTPVTLPFDPMIPKSKGVPLLPGMNVWTKFEEGRSRRSCVIYQNTFGTFDQVTLIFEPEWPQNQLGSSATQNGHVHQVWKVDQGVLKSLIGNSFSTLIIFWPRWHWPLVPKSIGFLCYPGWTCGPSLRKVDQGILELLIRHKVTDRRTDMCKGIYAFSSAKWA